MKSRSMKGIAILINQWFAPWLLRLRLRLKTDSQHEKQLYLLGLLGIYLCSEIREGPRTGRNGTEGGAADRELGNREGVEENGD